MSTSVQQVPPPTSSLERRFYPRIVPQAPVFVALSENHSEESLLLNVSENGLLVSTPADLACNFVARLSIRLHGLPKPVQVTARVVWASEANKLAGIQLLDLTEHDRRQIRKWGARESAPSGHREPEHPLLVVPPFKSSSETPSAASSFAAGMPAGSARDIVPLLPARITPHGSTSNVERFLIWGLYLAAACLVAAFFFRKDVLGNPFAHFAADRSESSAASLLAQDIQGSSPARDISNHVTVTRAALPAPTEGSAKSKDVLAVPRIPHDSAKTVEAATKSATEAKQPNAQRDLSLSVAIPATTGAPPLSGNSFPDPSPLAEAPAKPVLEANTQPPSADPSAPKQPPSNPARPADVPSNASPTVPPTPPSTPMVAPTRPSLSPKYEATVIRMDPPRNQVLEVRLPGAHQASFLGLPGERVLQSPSVTMHIQRAVLMPATHAGWPFNRSKKVVVGELLSRVDPQAAQISAGPGNSVRVRATIAADGRIENIKQILGPANLTPTVAKALQEWRYQPTLVDNKPVETQCYVVFQFHTPSYSAAKR